MELITRVLAGVIAAWIPMDGGDQGKRSWEEGCDQFFCRRSWPRIEMVVKHAANATTQEKR